MEKELNALTTSEFFSMLNQKLYSLKKVSLLLRLIL